MAPDTDNFVYEHRDLGVLDELRKKNPAFPLTRRCKHRHPLWFTRTSALRG